MFIELFDKGVHWKIHNDTSRDSGVECDYIEIDGDFINPKEKTNPTTAPDELWFSFKSFIHEFSIYLKEQKSIEQELPAFEDSLKNAGPAFQCELMNTYRYVAFILYHMEKFAEILEKHTAGNPHWEIPA